MTNTPIFPNNKYAKPSPNTLPEVKDELTDTDLLSKAIPVFMKLGQGDFGYNMINAVHAAYVNYDKLIADESQRILEIQRTIAEYEQAKQRMGYLYQLCEWYYNEMKKSENVEVAKNGKRR